MHLTNVVAFSGNYICNCYRNYQNPVDDQVSRDIATKIVVFSEIGFSTSWNEVRKKEVRKILEIINMIISVLT